MLYIGVMSGTSCDGVDVVLVDFSNEIKINASQFRAYPIKLKNQLLRVIANESLPISSICQLDSELGHFYAHSINDLLQEYSISKDEINAIGLHGQTICHQPPKGQASRPNTLQIGSAAIVAQVTGITTVDNFRQMDMACGGQGAPLAPVLHQHIFAQPNQHVVVLNLGGIANITSINGDALLGFDTGPANCLMDEWIYQSNGSNYDELGQWAAQGNINQKLLKKMLAEPYFQLKPPKSTGRELFNANWLKQKLIGFDISAVDVQRTLLQLTVESIDYALGLLTREVDRIIVCGGGVHNVFLLQEIESKTSVDCISSLELGVDPDYVEGLLMAWLAKQHVDGSRLDLTKITGATKPLVYGVKNIV